MKTMLSSFLICALVWLPFPTYAQHSETVTARRRASAAARINYGNIRTGGTTNGIGAALVCIAFTTGSDSLGYTLTSATWQLANSLGGTINTQAALSTGDNTVWGLVASSSSIGITSASPAPYTYSLSATLTPTTAYKLCIAAASTGVSHFYDTTGTLNGYYGNWTTFGTWSSGITTNLWGTTVEPEGFITVTPN